MAMGRHPRKGAMGFLDSILKKKGDSTADVDSELSQGSPSPEATNTSSAQSKVAAKLKGVFNG